MKKSDNLSLWPAVKVGPKYQVVIPKQARQIANKIEPGREVVVNALDEWSLNIRIKPTPEEWVRITLGMDKESWQDTDSTEYIKNLRDEWEKKLSKIHS